MNNFIPWALVETDIVYKKWETNLLYVILYFVKMHTIYLFFSHLHCICHVLAGDDEFDKASCCDSNNLTQAMKVLTDVQR